MRLINHIPSLSSLPFTLPHPTNTPPHTLYLFYSPVFHYYFLGQCWKDFLNVSPVDVLYFGPFEPFHYSPLPLPTPSFPTAFNPRCYILTRRCYVLCMLALCHQFSFPSSPESHSVVPLLQTCSRCEFVCDHWALYTHDFILGFNDISSRYF
jgi:hypothetical protein